MQSTKAKRNSVFNKITIWLIASNFQQTLPVSAQVEPTNAGYYPVVFAARNIKAGTLIAKSSDVCRVEKRSEERDQNSAFSPHEILGYKLKRDLRKNQIINQRDIDFKFRSILPTRSGPKMVDTQFIPNTYATRNLKAGTFIKSTSDLGLIELQKNVYPASVFSPREIIGYKTKHNLLKNQAISYVDLDFDNRNNRDTKVELDLSEQLKIARKTWSSTSDDYWELCGPKGSTSVDEGGGIIVATKNIKKNSVILNASDIELIFVPQGHIPGGALTSPFLALGGVTRYAIAKNSIVFKHDLVFYPKFTSAETLQFEKTKKVACHKWSGLSSGKFLRRD